MTTHWRRTLISTAIAGFAVLGITACGSSSGGSTNSSSDGVSTVADLPLASSPVVSDGSASLSSKGLHALTKALASNGVVLKTMGNSSFNTNSSLAMCEYANMLKQSLNEAVQGDTILCYVKQMDDDFSAVSGLNVYDGNPHVFNITFSDEDSGSDFPVKLQITRDSAGSISDFKMWSCENGSQSEYLHQSISGSDFTLTSKYVDGGGAWRGSTTVTGTLNSSNQFTAKTIVNSNSYTESNSSGYGSRTVVQGADSATISAWDKGTWSWGDGTGAFQRSFCSNGELLNPSLISTIAVGSGAATGAVSGSYDGGTYNDTFSQGWNGDTTLAESNAFLTGLTCTAPDVGTEPTIAFTGDEVFDCGISGATTLTVNGTDIMAACEDLSLGWEWVNCWDTIESDNVENDN